MNVKFLQIPEENTFQGERSSVINILQYSRRIETHQDRGKEGETERDTMKGVRAKEEIKHNRHHNRNKRLLNLSAYYVLIIIL